MPNPEIPPILSKPTVLPPQLISSIPATSAAIQSNSSSNHEYLKSFNARNHSKSKSIEHRVIRERPRSIKSDSISIDSEVYNPKLKTKLTGATRDQLDLNQLSWGKWWPIQFIEPEEIDTAGIQFNLPDSEPPRSFIDLFVGRGDSQRGGRKRESSGLSEEDENRLLETDLEDLTSLSQQYSTQPARAELSSPMPHNRYSASPSKSTSPSRQPSRNYLPTSTFSSSSSFPNSLAHYETVPINHARRYSTGNNQNTQDIEEAEGDIYDLIRENYRSPRLPIVFCHGLFGFSTIGVSVLERMKAR